MCMIATALFPKFCLENGDAYIQCFSAISFIVCKSVFDFVTKPGAPTGIDDKCRAIDMGVTLRRGPTGLLLGDLNF